jgi:hypothetical protein
VWPKEHLKGNLVSKVFLLHPESEQFLSGDDSHLPGHIGVGCLLAPVAVLLLALASFWAANFQAKELDSLRRNRAGVRGKVVSRHVGTTVGGIDVETFATSVDDDYLVKYRFEVPAANGPQTFEREASVPEKDYQGLKPGSRVNVVYDQKNPSHSRLECEADSHDPVVVFVGGYMLSGVSIVGFIAAVVYRKRNRSLCREGQKIDGRVVNCEGTDQEDGGLHLKVKYSFDSPSGREITDTVSASRNDLTKETLPAPGTPLVVFYLNDKVHRLL